MSDEVKDDRQFAIVALWHGDPKVSAAEQDEMRKEAGCKLNERVQGADEAGQRMKKLEEQLNAAAHRREYPQAWKVSAPEAHGPYPPRHGAK